MNKSQKLKLKKIRPSLESMEYQREFLAMYEILVQPK